ncbi:hypothetical protein QUA15_26960, partial [Microcoleus sp. Pol8_C1]
MTTNNIMTYLVSQRTRCIGAVAVDASQQASWFSICSVPIAPFQASYTIHSFKNLATLGCIGIVAALDSFSQVVSKFEKVSTS